MKKKIFIFDSEKIGSHKFIHFQSNSEINFANESTTILAYSNNSENPYFIDYIERFIKQKNLHDTTSFDFPIPTNCNHLAIKLIGFTYNNMDKITASII